LDYLKVVYKRKWLILILMLIVTVMGTFNAYRPVPVYQATCTIRIGERVNTMIQSGQVFQYTDYAASEKNINTHLSILMSEPVLQEVIRSRDLMTLSQKPLRPSNLRSYLSAEAVKDTNLIRINATHTDPAMAQCLANALATAYQDFTLQKRLESSKNNVYWLKKEIADLKKKMEESDYDLYQYKQKSQILSIDKETKMQGEELSQLRSALNQTQVKRIENEAQAKELDRILQSQSKYVPSFLQGEILPTLSSQLVEAKLRLAQLQKSYGPKHPKIIEAQSNIASIQTQIDQNIQKAIKSLESEHAVLEAKEKTLETSINDYTKKAMETEQKEIQYSLLSRETQSNKELYDILLAKLKEVNITEGMETPEVTVIEMAQRPAAPLNSRRNLNLTIAAVVGLVFSLGFAFFLEYLDVGLSTREEAERYLGLPVLGVIPQTKIKT
jgi:uncharacterized protein involved in exopolysaccharide biosynthesis